MKPNTPNTPNIAEIRQMVAAATPGPWKVYRDKALGETLIGTAYDHPQLKGPNSIVGHVFSAQGEYVYIRDNDADLIAEAPETIAALCDEVERQHMVIEGMRRKIDELTMELQNYQWAHGELRKDKERQAKEIERLEKMIADANAEHEEMLLGEALRRDTQ